MESNEEYIREFDKKYSSVVDSAVIELSKTFDTLFVEEKSALILSTIKTANSMLAGSFNIPSKMQISYDIANGYHDLRVISQEHNESFLEKEVYFLRNALDMYENNYSDDDSSGRTEVKIARYIAMRAYTNIGNAMRILGRYIVAIDYFQNALLINNGFAMASLNLSFVLFSYAQLQIKPYEQNYFHHACYNYYKQTQQYHFNLEDPRYLDSLEENISRFDSEYIESYLSKELNLPPFAVDNAAEYEYRNYMLTCRLFLEPCLDILSSPCFAVDSIHLPLKIKDAHAGEEFIGLFNQIKQEYNLARYLWYQTTVLEEPARHFADNEMDFIKVGDSADFSYREGLLRTAFKTIYSVFDRVGFFINQYFNIGLSDTKISFKNIWRKELRDSKGEIYFTVPNPVIIAHSSNPMIMAMYWLQKDFFEDRKTNITSPDAEPIFQMRNDIEHNCLRTGKQALNTIFTKYTSEGKIEHNTYKLLRLAREVIIYLCLAVNFESKKLGIPQAN